MFPINTVHVFTAPPTHLSPKSKMSPKALLILFVFCTTMAVVYAGAVRMEACDELCDGRVNPDIKGCCNAHQYKRGHCAFFWFTKRAWCDEHY